jgi:hypothetical protein
MQHPRKLLQKRGPLRILGAANSAHRHTRELALILTRLPARAQLLVLSVHEVKTAADGGCHTDKARAVGAD